VTILTGTGPVCAVCRPVNWSKPLRDGACAGGTRKFRDLAQPGMIPAVM
jgi:hypothetical protein